MRYLRLFSVKRVRTQVPADGIRPYRMERFSRFFSEKRVRGYSNEMLIIACFRPPLSF